MKLSGSLILLLLSDVFRPCWTLWVAKRETTMLDDSLPSGVYTTSPNRWRTCSSGFSSPGCGTCWELTYVNAQRFSTSINVLLIDIASPNYNIALEAMNELIRRQLWGGFLWLPSKFLHRLADSRCVSLVECWNHFFIQEILSPAYFIIKLTFIFSIYCV